MCVLQQKRAVRDVIKILDSGTLVQVIQWLTAAAYMANES